jgi:hypothetical protein
MNNVDFNELSIFIIIRCRGLIKPCGYFAQKDPRLISCEYLEKQL